MTLKKITVKECAYCALFAALTFAGSLIKVPMPAGYSYITLQTLFVSLSGVILGPKLGAISQLLYIILGLLGVPVFTEGGGIMYLFKPSFGYIIAWIPSAYLAGYIAKKLNRGYIGALLAMLAAIVPVYAIGIPYTYVALRVFMGKSVFLLPMIQASVLAFLPGDILTAVLGAFAAVKIKKLPK